MACKSVRVTPAVWSRMNASRSTPSACSRVRSAGATSRWRSPRAARQRPRFSSRARPSIHGCSTTSGRPRPRYTSTSSASGRARRRRLRRRADRQGGGGRPGEGRRRPPGLRSGGTAHAPLRATGVGRRARLGGARDAGARGGRALGGGGVSRWNLGAVGHIDHRKARSSTVVLDGWAAPASRITSGTAASTTCSCASPGRSSRNSSSSFSRAYGGSAEKFAGHCPRRPVPCARRGRGGTARARAPQRAWALPADHDESSRVVRDGDGDARRGQPVRRPTAG